MKQFDVVKVVAFRDDRFSCAAEDYERSPALGDLGTIVEVYSHPEPAFEVECSDRSTGQTIWLAAMYPEELSINGR
jgi:hypothetical protein